MPTFTTYREASKDEMGREIDRCHKVIADLEARLARVPSRETVARALARNDGYSHDWCDRASVPGSPEASCFVRHLIGADAVLALFDAKSETEL